MSCRIPSRGRLGLVSLLFLLLPLSSCNQRNLAPELECSESDVRLIRQEMDNIDWQ